MSILAGIFSRAKGPVPEPWIEALEGLISRNPADRIEHFHDARCHLAKVDVGAFGACGFRESDRSVAMVAGEPGLKARNGAFGTRSEDLRTLHESWARGDWSILSEALGVYCAAHYDSGTARLRIMTDKLGERPLYVWAGEEYVVFASALRILEGFSAVPKRLSVRGLAEIAAFGFSLGDRTGYADIFRLRAGEVVDISESGVYRSQYWRWDEIAPSLLSEAELLRQAYEAFSNAVTRLAGRDTGTLAFLSGGLDSRCVVAALRSRNLSVHTFNFSLAGSQDGALARAFAQAAGTEHREEPVLPGQPLSSMARRTLDHWHPSPSVVERRQLLWSGDGGSVGLGHVYLRAGTVEHLQAGRWAAAVDSFLQDMFAAIPLRLLSRQIRQQTIESPKAGLEEELANIRFKDPVKRFYAFLMLNDQRRHLTDFYEDIDLHRLEFLLPFFDGAFLETMMAVPAEWGLYHRFYNKWLALFPPMVTAVPWQSYPEHEPCPLPLPAGLSYQWSSVELAERNRLQRTRFMVVWRAMLGGRDFPSRILDKWYVRAVGFLHWAGVRDYTYALRIAGAYYRHWSNRSRDEKAAISSK